MLELKNENLMSKVWITFADPVWEAA